MNKLFNIDSNINNSSTVVSFEELTNESMMEKELDQLVFSLEDRLRSINEAHNIIASLESRNILDKNLSASGKFDDQALRSSFEELMNICDSIGYSSNLTLENISFEALEGERKSIGDRLVKWFENAWQGILSIVKEAENLIGLLQSVKISKLAMLKKQLENNELVSIGDKYIKSSILSKKLAIYGAMGNKDVKLNTLQEHLSIPYNLIVKENLLEQLSEYAIDNLVVSKTLENDIPKHKPSVDVVDKIVVPEIREWLNKDTKLAMFSNTIGDRIKVLSVYQDDKGADARYDNYKISSKYHIDNINVFNTKELIELCKTGLELADNTEKLASKGKKSFFETMWQNLRTSFMTQVFTHLFSIFAIKRIWRQAHMVDIFAGGLVSNLVSLKKNHIDSINLITELVTMSTTSKK